MYWKHFGLNEDPFSLTSDSRFVFLSEAHRDVLATLYESVETERGFAALIAPAGVGKTTLLYELIEQLRDIAVSAFVFATHFEPIDTLRLLLKELGVDNIKTDTIGLHQQFAEALARVASLGKRFVVVIDEAQSLSPAALETIRLLSNLEVNRKKPVQVILAGHHEFEELLARPGLQPIKQRIAAYGRLKPFTKAETHEYVNHRVRIAGGAELFTPEALDVLADLSQGVARTINIYGFQALHAALKKGVKTVDSEITRQAIHEFEGWPLPSAAPVLQRRVVPPQPAPKSARTSLEDDDYFDTGKDQGLQALLESIRSDRTREQSQPAAMEPARAAAVAETAATPTATRPEPIPFSIAAVLKSTESSPAVNRTAAATAPALEKQEEAQVIAEPVKQAPPVVKAPMLVVPPAAKPVGTEPAPIPAPLKPNKKATTAPERPLLWRDWRAQLGAAIAGLVILAGIAGAVVYKNGWFSTAQTASAAPVNRPTAATQPAPSNVTTEVTHTPPTREESKPEVLRPFTPAKASGAAPASSVAEIAPGKGKRLVAENEPAPSAPISLGTSAQPNFGAALAPSSSGVTLQTAKVSDVKPAVPIAQPKPVYPDMANRLGITGVVVLKVQVNAHGKPTKVSIISGHPMLAAAAQSAVLNGWRFSPATLGGNPVESESEVKINFRASR